MKIWNRLWGFLILFLIILSIYWFYKYFFSLKLTSIEINSNIWNYELSLENIKFTKNILCEYKKCVVNEIPPFEYKLIIKKENYKDYKDKIIINSNTKIDVFLEKNILLERIDEKKVTRLDIVQSVQNKKNEDFYWESISYNKIYADKNYLYFQKEDKLYINNLTNNNFIKIDFVPNVKYIKKLENDNLLVNTDVWSFVLNLLNNNVQYFSIFSDFIKIDNNYIWIINFDDISRKKNFWFENIDWNLIISYDIKTKKSYILKNTLNNIEKIYLDNKKLYIENNLWENFELTWYIDDK